MCELTTALAGVGALSGVVGTIASSSASSKNASAANKANAENYVAQTNYNDDVWEQDIDYGYKTLAYEQDAVDRQWDWFFNDTATTEKNTQINEGQAILASVQQNMADTMQSVQSQAQAQGQRAADQAGADGRGVQGNSVQSIISSVNQQENEDQGVMAINRSAQNQQARINVASAKAAGDAQFGNVQAAYKVYSPQAPIREAAPVTMQAAQQGPSALGTALSVGGQLAVGVDNGIKSYSQANAQGYSQTVSSLGNWISGRTTGNASKIPSNAVSNLSAWLKIS